MLPRWTCVAALFVVCAGTAAAQDPFRFVPGQAEVVVRIHRPREHFELIRANTHIQDAIKLPGIRDYYDSTTFQRIYQLIGYFEKELGKSKEQLLDDLAGGDIVVAGKFSDPGGALFVMQGKDENQMRRFAAVALDLLQKEFDRQESKDRIELEKNNARWTGRIGPKVSFAVVRSALLVASDENVLKRALEAAQDGSKENILHVADFQAARKQAPPQALAWAWFHLDKIRAMNPNFKNGIEASTMDPFQMLLFGGLTNLVKRSPYATFTATHDRGEYRLGIYMPRGRDGIGPLAHMLLPTDGNATLAPLTPPRTLSSTSYFLDLGQYFDKRVDILGEKNAKGLDDVDKNLGKFLGGIKISKLLNAMGTHHRIVVQQPKERPYKIRPTTPLPSFALVVDMRDPLFAKNMNSILRTAALAATFKYGLTLKEDTLDGCDLVSYYLSETKKVDDDPTNLRFNFSPSYAAVGNHFVVSSSAELARDLIGVLKAEKPSKASTATMRTQVHASGFAELIRANEANVLTQLILSQGLPPDAAAAALRSLLGFVERLGSVQIEQTYGARDFHYDIIWKEPRTKK